MISCLLKSSKFRFLFFGLFSIAALFLIIKTTAQQSTQTSNQNESLIAQPSNLHQWGAVTLFHGLPSDRVRAIAQDADGVMWFGTDAGLARYDGRRTQTITTDELLQGKINALSLDANKTLWIGTDGGILRYQNKQIKLIKETEARAITSFLHLENNRTLATTRDGLIFDIQINNESSITVKTIPRESLQPLQSADVDNPGALELTSLVQADGKVFIGSQSKGVFELVGEDAKEIRSEPRAYFVNALATDEKESLWIGARASAKASGLYESSNSLRPRKVGEGLGTVLSLRSDRRNNLWVGTDAQGVFQFRDGVETNRFTFDGTAGGLRSNRIFMIFVDREDVVWFGTDRGVSRYDPRALRVERLSESAESNFIRTIYRTKNGTLYSGTNRSLFYQQGTTWKSVSELSQKTVYAIDEDANGRLIVGTASGLYVKSDAGFHLLGARPQKPQIKPEEQNEDSSETAEPEQKSNFQTGQTYFAPSQSKDNIRSIVQFQNKTYVANFGRGVELVDGDNQKLVFPKVSDDSKLKETNALYADAKGRLWIGTNSKGVFIFDGKNAISNPALAELENVSIASIDESRDGSIFFATAKGLYLFKQEKLTLVLAERDVRSVRVLQTAESKANQVWCATADNGVYKILFEENKSVIISSLDAEQGLPSQKAFALLKEKNSQGADVWLIGTNRGLARYEVNTSPPILLASRAIGRREYAAEELKNNLLLDYPQNSLVLEVAATSSRTFPEQFQYAFTLFNDKNEISMDKITRESQFSMQGLKTGKYRVEVVAYNSDLISSEPLKFEFTVASAPFPYTIVLLMVLLLFAAAALVWAIFEHRKITSTSAALAEANNELADARLRLANEAESERRRIARDLHDQTLADLRRLVLMSDQLKENGDTQKINPVRFRAEIENVSNEIRRICEDLSPSVLENVGFAAALEFALTEAVAHLPEDKRFEFEFICDDDLEERLSLAQGMRMQLYRIAQEAISNICRHADAKHVRFEISLNRDEFVMKLEDDGKGFDLNQNSSGRGLANISARASLIDADVKWLRSEKGTIFILRKENVLREEITKA